MKKSSKPASRNVAQNCVADTNENEETGVNNWAHGFLFTLEGKILTDHK